MRSLLMAKKKLELDKVQLDSELDFGFSMDDDIDGMINPDAKKPKKRTPVTDIAMGTITGAKSKLKDPSFIAEMTRKALPQQYGEVFDTADKVSGSLSSLYDETIREIKPELSRVAKKVDRLVPEESKFFKKLTSKFSELMGNEMSGFKGQDVKQQQEQAIQNSIAAVFQEQQIEEKARSAAQDTIDRSVDQKRFTSNISVLRHIDQGISRLSQYNDKVTQAYQKKSLELQYRSFFVQSEQLDTTKRYFEVFKAQHEAIAKNTALPEFVKIKDSERFKDQLKTKFIGNVQKSLFGDGDIINTAIERLKKKTKESAMVFKQAMEAGSIGLDEVESMRQMQQMMAEAGIEGDSAASMLGQVAGGGIVSHLGNKLGQRLRGTFDDESRIGKAGYQAANVLKNLSGNYDKIRNNQFLRDNEFEGGAKGFLAKGGNFIMDLLRPAGSDLTIKDAAGLQGINDIAPGFTNKAIRSLTDVIPGYLARIYREVASIRSGTESDLVMYDFNKGTFSTQTALSKDIKDILNAKAGSGINKFNTNTAISSLTEGVELDEETKKDFGVIIRALAQQRSDYSKESVANSDVLKGSKSKALFEQLVANKTSTPRGQYEFTNSMLGVKESFPNLMGDIETFVNAGYGDLLESQGLLKRNKEGGLDVDIEAYKKLIEDNVVSSDINVKRNISSLNPKDALAAVKNTKIYNWFYKLGKGDRKPHVGPMAQDVNSQLGEEAAPGGTKIDLTTMNGVNMAAIQALKEEHDQFTESDKGQEWLKLIKDDTAAIVALMQKGGGSVGAGVSKDDLKDVLSLRKGFYTSVVEPVIQGSFKAITGLFGTVQKGTTGIRDNAINPFINFVSKGYKDNKTWIQDSFKDLFKGAGELASKVFDFGKTTLIDTIPNSVKSAWAFGSNIKESVKKLLDGPKSIYLKGDPSHPLLSASLMKMGYYFDQISGKVITSIEDIKGPVVDKTGEVVLTTQHIVQGLVDKDGQEIKTFFEKMVSKAFNIASNTYTKVKDFYGNLANAALPTRLKNLFTSSDSVGGHKSYNVLVEIRDLIRDYTGATTSNDTVTGSSKDKSSTLKDKVEPIAADIKAKYATKGLAGGLFNKAKDYIGSKLPSKGILGTVKGFMSTKASTSAMEPQENKTNTTIADQVQQNHSEPVRGSEEVLQPSKTGKETWNDRDGSGHRDGDWRDRLANTKKKATTFLQADLKEKYRGENVIDMIGGQVKKLLGFLSDKAGGLFGKVGSIAEAGLGSLGLGKLGTKLKGIPGKVLGMGKSAAGALMSGVGKVSKVGGLLSKVGSVAKVGRIATVARTALAAGSLLTAGTGSAILAGASTAVAALGSILASPVVLGAAVTAAVAYGGYKLYKYATRDNIDVYESIRIKQYGLTNSEHDKHHIHELLALEEYLQDGRVGYDDGKAYLLDKKIDVQELLDIFSIDPNDDERVGSFTQWFEARFKPFFLNHLTAFYLFNNKGSLADVKKLNAVDKAKYLGMIGFESGPYDVTLSPFKDIDTLHSDPKIVKSTIEEALEESKKEIESKDKSPMDVAADKMRQMKALRDSDYWKKKSEQARQTVESVKNTIEQGISSTTSFAGQMWNKGVVATKSAYQSTTAAVGQAYDATKQAVGQAYDTTKQTVGEAYDATKEYVKKNMPDSVKGAPKKFVDYIWDATKRAADILQVDPTYIAAQAALESGWGKSKSASEHNNFFGMKAGKNWKGDTFTMGTREVYNGKEVREVAKWKKFPSPEANLEDYAAYIKRRFPAAVGAKSAGEYFTRLKEGGYATDPNYVSIGVSTANKIAKMDKKADTSSPTDSSVEKSNVIPFIPKDSTDKTTIASIANVSKGGPTVANVSSNGFIGGPTVANATLAGSSILDSIPQTSTSVLSGNPISPTPAMVSSALATTAIENTASNTGIMKTSYTGPVSQSAKPILDSQTSKDNYSNFNTVPVPSYTGVTSSGQGPGFAMPSLEKALDHVGETLNQSLDVQRQMLGTLRDILSNVNPENIQRVQEGLKQVATQTKPAQTLSRPAVDLSRKSA